MRVESKCKNENKKKVLSLHGLHGLQSARSAFWGYPSEDLPLNALDYAFRFTTITHQDRHIIIHAKESLLYPQNTPWTKKNTNDVFDVTMGSHDRAETCELIGTYMPSLIAFKFKDEVGLYRDDGLVVCKEKTKKEVGNVFKSNGLKITIDASKKPFTFLT